MAGAGWHDFIPGEVLTAANVQDYLQDQAVMKFASAAARTSALPAPSQGMMSFLNDTGAVETYYAAWNASTNPGGKTPAGWYPARNTGLVPIIPPTVRVSGGSATANSLGEVTFTNVSQLILDGVFTSAYTFYDIILRIDNATAASYINFRFTSAGTATTAALWYGGGSYSAAGAQNQLYAPLNGAADLSLMNAIITGYDSMAIGGRITVGSKNNEFRVTNSSHSFPNGSGGVYGNWSWNQKTIAFDGFRLQPTAGNMTGIISVYGYNK